MSKQTLTMAIVGSILSLLTQSKRQGIISDEYPLQVIKPFAYLSFMTGAIITKLEPQTLQSVNNDMNQLGNYDMSISEDWVERVEKIRQGLGEKTSNPYFVWIDGEMADAVKSKKRGFDFDKTAKIGLLCFHYGCILGAKHPKRVKSMFQADSQTDWQTVMEESGLSWEGLVEIAKGFLKQHKL